MTCLDQLLIAIMNLIAKLGKINATAWNVGLCTTALDCLSVSCHCLHTALTTIQTWHGEGEVGISESAVTAAGALGLCKVLCWLPLIASRSTVFLPSSARQSYTTAVDCGHTHYYTLAYKVPRDNASPLPLGD